jgi:hypothetical protein
MAQQGMVKRALLMFSHDKSDKPDKPNMYERGLNARETTQFGESLALTEAVQAGVQAGVPPGVEANVQVGSEIFPAPFRPEELAEKIFHLEELDQKIMMTSEENASLNAAASLGDGRPVSQEDGRPVSQEDGRPVSQEDGRPVSPGEVEFSPPDKSVGAESDNVQDVGQNVISPQVSEPRSYDVIAFTSFVGKTNMLSPEDAGPMRMPQKAGSGMLEQEKPGSGMLKQEMPEMPVFVPARDDDNDKQIHILLTDYQKQMESLEDLAGMITELLNKQEFVHRTKEPQNLSVMLRQCLENNAKANLWAMGVATSFNNLDDVLFQQLWMLREMAGLLIYNVDSTLAKQVLVQRDDNGSFDPSIIRETLLDLQKAMVLPSSSPLETCDAETYQANYNKLVKFIVTRIDKSCSKEYEKYREYMSFLLNSLFNLFTDFAERSGLGLNKDNKLSTSLRENVDQTLPYGAQSLLPGYEETVRQQFAENLKYLQQKVKDGHYATALEEDLFDFLQKRDWTEEDNSCKFLENWMQRVEELFNTLEEGVLINNRIDDLSKASNDDKNLLGHGMLSCIFERYQAVVATLMREILQLMRIQIEVQSAWKTKTYAKKEDLVRGMVQKPRYGNLVREFCNSKDAIDFLDELKRKSVDKDSEMLEIVVDMYCIVFGTMQDHAHFAVDEQVKRDLHGFFTGVKSICVPKKGEPAFVDKVVEDDNDKVVEDDNDKVVEDDNAAA